MLLPFYVSILVSNKALHKPPLLLHLQTTTLIAQQLVPQLSSLPLVVWFRISVATTN